MLELDTNVELIKNNICDLLFELHKALQHEQDENIRAYASGRISGLKIALTIIESVEENPLDKHYKNVYER